MNEPIFNLIQQNIIALGQQSLPPGVTNCMVFNFKLVYPLVAFVLVVLINDYFQLAFDIVLKVWFCNEIYSGSGPSTYMYHFELCCYDVSLIFVTHLNTCVVLSSVVMTLLPMCQKSYF